MESNEQARQAEWIQHLIAHCEQQQRVQARLDALVTYKRPPVAKNAEHVRFAPGGPLGQVLETSQQYAVVGWKASELLAFLRPILADLTAAQDA